MRIFNNFDDMRAEYGVEYARADKWGCFAVGDRYWHDLGAGGGFWRVWDGEQFYSDHATKNILDLSPLGKYVGGKVKDDRLWYPSRDGRYHWEEMVLIGGLESRSFVWDAPTKSWTCFSGVSAEMLGVGKTTSRMYGWDTDDQPKPKEEKLPQDKALDDFIAKRKVKRLGPAPGYGESSGEIVIDRDSPKRRQEEAIGRQLDRAMNKLPPHYTPIHDRLVPYRGPVL